MKTEDLSVSFSRSSLTMHLYNHSVVYALVREI